ncbi:cytochrome oxidase maturation protein, cbb3-type [Arcobacter sp. 31_11_sub10_T18]|nr:cytochrome oxidase maturation protein, cbb3-type [Arcobacter sp. 31_11_sub10_T18]
MDDNVISAMLFVSLGLGALGLFAFLWGLKTGQFDDSSKFLDGALHDSEEDLNSAKHMEDKQKKAKGNIDD